MVRKCPKCGKTIDDEAVSYCPFCGTRLGTTAPTSNDSQHPQPSNPQPSSTPWEVFGYIGIVLGIALLIAAVATGVYYTTYNLGFGISFNNYPYQGYAIPLGIGSAMCFIVGIMLVLFVRGKLKTS